MGLRRKGREAAFQLIYQIDLGGMSFEDASREFWDQLGVPKDARDFAVSLIKGVVDNLPKIDELISEYSHNWKLHRMNTVDKNILRIGVYELIFCADTPTKVVINEAIEIGKKFGTQDTGSFINGILDKIAKSVRENSSE